MNDIVIETLLIANILCHVEPFGVADWHYRTKIAPWPEQKCWYVGERMKSRKELYWAETPRAPPTELELSPTKLPWELEPRFKGE